MGIELDIVEELASISVTLTELSSIAKIINGEIKNAEFDKRFNKMVTDLAKSYDVVTANLLPLFEFDSEAALINSFDECHSTYSACYLKEISKPRAYADEAYEEYLLLKGQKECKTSFPLLKRTFLRLDKFVDKWITNDAWLAMSIDNLFKRLQTLLNEIATLKKKDPADAFLIYNAAFHDFHPYLGLIRQQRTLLEIRSD